MSEVPLYAKCSRTELGIPEAAESGRLDAEGGRLAYSGTSPMKKRTPPGPYRRPMPMALSRSQGGRFLVIEVSLYAESAAESGPLDGEGGRRG